MSYFKICPYCDANLDPGEKCDCGNKRPYIRQTKSYRVPVGFMFITKLDGQIELVEDRKNEQN